MRVLLGWGPLPVVMPILNWNPDSAGPQILWSADDLFGC